MSDEPYLDSAGKPIALEKLVRLEPEWAANRIRAQRSADELLQLIEQCLKRGHGVEVLRCGPYAEPGRPLLAKVRQGGFGTADHMVYGDNAREILREAMEHVLAHGFTQEQDRYGLGLQRRPCADPAEGGADASD